MTLNWKFYCPGVLFSRFSEEWTGLNVRAAHNHPLLDLKFVEPLYKYFGSPSTRFALCSSRDDVVVAASLIERKGNGIWEVFRPAQACLGPFLIDVGVVDPCECIDGLLRALPGHNWLLGIQMLDPKYMATGNLDSSPRAKRINHTTTTHIDLRGSFSGYWQGRPKKLRARVRRLLAALEADGIDHRLIELQRKDQILEGIRQHATLESRGWKGAAGTAIQLGSSQGMFYRQVLERFADNRGGYVYQLSLGKRIAASLLCILQGGMLVVLKTTYDGQLRRYAPGRLLDYFMLEKAFGTSDFQIIENYTNASKEDEKWCTGKRPIFHMNYYASTGHRWMAHAIRSLRCSADRSNLSG